MVQLGGDGGRCDAVTRVCWSAWGCLATNQFSWEVAGVYPVWLNGDQLSGAGSYGSGV